jgi:anti-anti-sigma regulatory factor
MDVQRLVELERRVAELEQINAEQAASLAALQREHVTTRVLLETMAHGVVACDEHGTLILFNRTSCEWHGMDAMNLPPEKWADHYDLYGPDGKTPLPTEEIPLLRAFKGERVRNAGMSIAVKGESPRYILADGDPLFDAAGRKLGAVVVMTDVTERKRAEETLKRLSTPLIPISDRTVVMPLIGALDSRRAEQVMATILDGIAAYRAGIVIIDVTGVATIDTEVAGTLVRVAQAVRLLGAKVFLTGIRPELAQALVTLGTDLRGIATYGTLQSAIAAALAQGRD